MTKKKWLLVFLILSGLAFSCLFMNYIANEKMIHDYKNGIYKENNFAIMGFTQPYIKDYNRGNVHYQLGDYLTAILDYRKALHNHPPKYRECQIRINLALAMMMSLEVEEITEQNKDQVVEMLVEARDILVEKECAHMEDDGGHSADAQQLKNEIDALLDAIENAGGEGKESEEKPEGQQGEDDKPSQEKPAEKTELQKQFEQMQKDGQRERNEKFEYDDAFSKDYEYYSGKVW